MIESAVDVGVTRTTSSSLAASVIADVQPEETEPRTAVTPSATSELNALRVSVGSIWSSFSTNSICCPFTPPAALISSLASSQALTTASPYAAIEPVLGEIVPILIGSLLAAVLPPEVAEDEQPVTIEAAIAVITAIDKIFLFINFPSLNISHKLSKKKEVPKTANCLRNLFVPSLVLLITIILQL
ncbi:hypothetical protein SDC9_87683 [bioreactor metagenome]|uniref:Uncharacterized protein n=1 Tax=bioreactor metagenome TaxID=1076179 RepID=A0A644ZTY5_9ZZZZ